MSLNLSFKGQATSLPDNGNEGDVWSINYHLFVYQSNEWIDLGSFRGAVGPQGNDGPRGYSITPKGVTTSLPSSNVSEGDAWILNYCLYIWDGASWVNFGDLSGGVSKLADKAEANANTACAMYNASKKCLDDVKILSNNIDTSISIFNKKIEDFKIPEVSSTTVTTTNQIIASLDTFVATNVSDVLNFTGNAKLIILATENGGSFYYDASDITSQTDYGVVLVDGHGRRWKRTFSDSVNIKWFGAAGNGIVDDTGPIQMALNYNKVFIPCGTYKISKPLLFKNKQEIFGDGRYNTTIVKTFDGEISRIPEFFKISNITIDINSTKGQSFLLGKESVATVISKCDFVQFVDSTILIDGQCSAPSLCIEECNFGPINFEKPAIVLPNDNFAGVYRSLLNLSSDGILVDLGSSSHTRMSGCVSNNGLVMGCPTNLIISNCDIKSLKSDLQINATNFAILGCLIAGNTVINGTNGTISGCSISGAVTNQVEAK